MVTDLDHCISCQSVFVPERVEPIVFSSSTMQKQYCVPGCVCQGQMPLLFLKSFPVLSFILILTLKMWPCKSTLISFDKHRLSVRRHLQQMIQGRWADNMGGQGREGQQPMFGVISVFYFPFHSFSFELISFFTTGRIRLQQFDAIGLSF